MAHAPLITRVRREYRSARRRLQTKATARSANPWTNTLNPPGASCPRANWLHTHGMHRLQAMYMPKPNSGKKARALPIARHPSPSESRIVLYAPLEHGAPHGTCPLQHSTPYHWKTVRHTLPRISILRYLPAFLYHETSGGYKNNPAYPAQPTLRTTLRATHGDVALILFVLARRLQQASKTQGGVNDQRR